VPDSNASGIGKLKVAVVTPANNEEENLPLVAKSMLSQTMKPTIWIIVDDESSDRTALVARELANNEPWVTVLERKKGSGFYDGSFIAFKAGADAAKEDWDLLLKLDADTTLPPDFLQRLIAKFEEDDLVGIASGISTHPRGNNRMYRKECWEEIKFPDDGLGWDTVDEVFARLNGWRTEAFPDIVCVHMRSKLPNAKYRYHQGRLSRHLGYYSWFVLGRLAKMLITSGTVASLAYGAGFLRGGFGQVNEEIRRAVRRGQRGRVTRILGVPTAQVVRAGSYTPRFDGLDPLITIGMPTLNRSKHLRKVLEGLYNCSYPRERTRLVFVDGFSTDGTYKMLQDFSQEHVREYDDLVLLEDKGNIPAARNICIENLGQANFLLFLDSDVLVMADFICRLLGLIAVGDISSIFYSSFSFEKPKPLVKYVHTVGMGCTLIKKEVVNKVGLFDTSLSVNEDTDYCLRAGKLGFKIVQDTATHYLHLDEGRYSPEQTIKQSIKYRRGYAKIFRMGIYRNRFILYAALDLTVALGFVVHPAFSAGIIVYFAMQLIRRRNFKLAFYLTVNSLILCPLTLLGLLERRSETPVQPQHEATLPSR
jgi:glycosyltransferase involved in cell wall biosynthesis